MSFVICHSSFATSKFYLGTCPLQLALFTMNHIQPKLTDYVLDLLSGQERRDVDHHVAICSVCQDALDSEMQMGRAIQQSLHLVTQPTNGRLQQLMPPIPRKRERWQLNLTLQRQIASALVLSILILGGFGWYNATQQNGFLPAPTYVAITATFTSEPTATEANGAATALPTETAVANQQQPNINVNATPPPLATPVAMLSN